MMRLPPVRRAVSLARNGIAAGKAAFHAGLPGYEAHLYDSGTSALGIAIADARLRHGSIDPEAVLPAYCCPDVVAACLFAGVRPRLVDMAPSRWGYDLEALKAALTRNTVAVVAVDLLGVGDAAEEVLPAVRANGSLLIQDSAQSLPAPADARWLGDYVVFSFGRGKPLNLLRGGAVAAPRGRSLWKPPQRQPSLRQRLSAAALGTRAAALAFNVVSHPRLYWMTSQLPGLGLGATRYHPLNTVDLMPESMWGQVGPAYVRYSTEAWDFPWQEVLSGWERLGLRTLDSGAALPHAKRRLRLAVLAENRAQRDEIVRTLDKEGLGISAMYDVPLNRIAGVPAEIMALEPFPMAEELAGRLFTLPTHSAVTPDVVARTDRCLRLLLEASSRRPLSPNGI